VTSTGKKARQQHGTRFAAKRAKTRRAKKRGWDKLPVSASRGNAEAFVRGHA
jgi:hypothetical protein